MNFLNVYETVSLGFGHKIAYPPRMLRLPSDRFLKETGRVAWVGLKFQ
jgi:hypothetical protein